MSESESNLPELGDYVIPDETTLWLAFTEIADALEDDEPVVFTERQEMLRYKVHVEVIDEPCENEGCEKPPLAFGYCSSHCREADKL